MTRVLIVACDIPPEMCADLERNQVELLPLALALQQQTEQVGLVAGPPLSLPVRRIDAQDVALLVRQMVQSGRLEIGFRPKTAPAPERDVPQ